MALKIIPNSIGHLGGGEISVVGGGAAASPLLNNLVSYWKLDEASNGSVAVERADSVGGMTLIEAVGNVSSATGKVNRGSLHATTYLLHADHPTLKMGNIDFTISFWMNPSQLLGNYPGLVGKDNTGGTRDYLVILDYPTAGKVGFQVVTAGGVQNLANTATISVGSWYFVVAWHDASADKMYLQINDGIAAEKATGGSLVAASSNDFKVGALGAAIFQGVIDEVALWKRVLTPAERTALYNGGAGLTHPF